MVENDIAYIQRSIHHHLADLHLLFTHNMLNVDIQCLNEVNMALLAAEDTITKAVCDHVERIKITNYSKTFPLLHKRV
jgi:hypothetical protein